jgi:hypothetical protein
LEGWKSRGILAPARPNPNPQESQMIRGVAAPATGDFQKSLPVKPRFSLRPQSPAIPLRNADVPIGINPPTPIGRRPLSAHPISPCAVPPFR